MIPTLIEKYKRLRTEQYLAQTYQYAYAFVGIGQHSLSNLYPVLHYLQVPLKYICVTSEEKARMVERKFHGVTATASLKRIVDDEAIKGVFVSASPSAHESIASQIMKSGKSLFIEKPPCQSMEELDRLIAIQKQSAVPITMVGLQKRYVPAIQLLKKRLSKEHLINYDLHYLTGNYPEGNALLDLYIHPIDLVVYLFGKPEIITYKEMSKDSYILMLQHPHIVGTLELSSSYSWSNAEETMKVCTQSGVYCLMQMDTLTFSPKPTDIFGVPMEKVMSWHDKKEVLLQRNNFNAILTNNQIYTNGYFNEIVAFTNGVEGKKTKNLTSLDSVRDTYEIIEKLNL
ncbi:MAG: Gfo/Idh/MocA family oxidoreductase [Bacteroidaceae bacterium]|nr:Gfo/Idh/MocA family oxidoreductase [Bacteroidaceae bacterium]